VPVITASTTLTGADLAAALTKADTLSPAAVTTTTPEPVVDQAVTTAPTVVDDTADATEHAESEVEPEAAPVPDVADASDVGPVTTAPTVVVDDTAASQVPTLAGLTQQLAELAAQVSALATTSQS
jgi:hypothetical protein